MSTVPLRTTDPTAEREWLRRVVTDTGFVCRNVLGWNFDKNEQTGRVMNVGTGGIRSTGPHQQMVEFVDSPSRLKLLLAPRNAYKSTIMAGKCVRTLLANPDAAILYGMMLMDKAEEKSLGIRAAFEHNDQIKRYWGDQRSQHWQKKKWTLAGRRNKNRAEPSLSMFTMQKPQTGGHYDLIILDDLIDWSYCRTREMIEYQHKILKSMMPLRAPGGQVIVVGTRYSDNDIYAYLEGLDSWDKLVLDAGMEPVEDEDGKLVLVGEPTFPNLDRGWLEEQLGTMSFEEYCSQYLNIIATGIHDAFRREQFRSLPWDPRQMEGYTGYLLTDTAVSMADDACMSVVAYVLLDAAHNAYVADLRCGQMSVPQFVDEYMDVLTTWGSRCYHSAELMEHVTMNEVFRAALEDEARTRGERLNLVPIPRQGGKAKDERILGLQNRFERGRIYFLNTIPRTYVGQNRRKVLWDPEGHWDGTREEFVPGGELVEQFVKFRRQHYLQDIPDALADIDYVWKKTGKRACSYRPPGGRMRRGRQTRNLLRGQGHRPGGPPSMAEPSGSWHDRVARQVWGDS